MYWNDPYSNQILSCLDLWKSRIGAFWGKFWISWKKNASDKKICGWLQMMKLDLFWWYVHPLCFVQRKICTFKTNYLLICVTPLKNDVHHVRLIQKVDFSCTKNRIFLHKLQCIRDISLKIEFFGGGIEETPKWQFLTQHETLFCDFSLCTKRGKNMAPILLASP